MGKDVPVYQKHAPELPEVDLTKFPMQVVRVERPAHAQGWKNLKISLGQDFRMLYYDDVVFGAEWKELISDFDTRFLVNNFSYHATLKFLKLSLKPIFPD